MKPSCRERNFTKALRAVSWIPLVAGPILSLCLFSFVAFSADVVLIIDDDTTSLSDKIDRSVPNEVLHASSINQLLGNNPDYFEHFAVVIYSQESWENIFNESTRDTLASYADNHPTVIYGEEGDSVEIPAFDATYDVSSMAIFLEEIPDPVIETTYVTWKIDRTQLGGEHILIKAGETAVGLLEVPGADALSVYRATSGGGVGWGLVSIAKTIAGKVFIASLPACKATWWAKGGACWLTALSSGVIVATTAAEVLKVKDAGTIEEVRTSTTVLQVNQGTLTAEEMGITVADVRSEHEPLLGYPVLKTNPGTLVYSNGFFEITAAPYTHFLVGNETIAGAGLCSYPCGTITDKVFFSAHEDRIDLEIADGKLDLYNNHNRLFTFDQPELVSLGNSGMQGEGVLQPKGNKTTFKYDNNGDIYACQPVVLYGSVHPVNVPVGKESTIIVTVTNLGPETIQSLWLGLDIHDPAGNKAENTKTPIADEPAPFGTGEIGWIDFSSQGSSLKPGESRTFMATYSFRKSVTGHQYHVGAYTYRFRAWANGYPGQEGAIPVGPLQSEILRVTDGSAEATSSTVLVIDTSGSMKGEDRTGKTKIDAAREAAIDLVNMLRSGSSSTSSHEVAVVAFSTSARTVIPMTSDYDAAIAEINTMSADGNTNVHQGMVLANGQLQNAAGKPIIILLSDGMPTAGPGGDSEGRKQAVLAGPVKEASERGYCIYVVGFGEPSEGNIDQDFLNAIVQAAGCDDGFYTATEAVQLHAAYVEMRYNSMGWNLIRRLTDAVQHGEEKDVGEISIPPSQQALHATLVWPGSQLDLILEDPQGRPANVGYPGATIDVYDNMVYTIVSDPLSGTWKASVYGRDIPLGSTKFAFLASVEPAEEPAPSQAIPERLIVTTYCPVDLAVKDPEGLVVNKQFSNVPETIYTEEDMNQDGDPDDQIIIPNRKVGDYQIRVIPEERAFPIDRYTLEVSDGFDTIVLADYVRVSDIPEEPYVVTSTAEGIAIAAKSEAELNVPTPAPTPTPSLKQGINLSMLIAIIAGAVALVAIGIGVFLFLRSRYYI